ncbi:patatin-like phospholipase family protein [Undibacterium sp. Tian12W]|uniref:patatin-like phospholipase family protein n=1 Tax=Undibacterium sp. Tian12W TaxID=3413054 RepID=UPI003BF2200A
MSEATYPVTPQVAVDKIFPLTQPGPAAHTFELALVLGGTVSAGCYTAGVLDFLIEALDAWAAAIVQDDKDNPGAPTVPRHKVLIRAVTGTSGGGVNAVLLSRALSYVYPPASVQTAPELRAKNPFYQIWVNAIDIDGLLATDDLDGATTITSLLSGKPLAAAAASGISFDSGQAAARQYVANPLPVILTYTNVAGIPYKQMFSGQTGRAEYFVNHADFVRFAIDIQGALPTPQYALAPDSFEVGNQTQDMLAWSGMSSYALGTAAFPVGLPAVQIARPAGHYAYRYILPNSGQGVYSPQWLVPEWSLFVQPDSDAGSKYAFVSLDGGCTDNAPIGLAHDVLAGIAPTRETSGSTVNRAIVLIDPFTDVPNFAALPKADLASILFPTINCLIQNNRFNSADLAAFTDGSDFSRFLITPSRKNAKGDPLTGGDAIASSGLAAFLGFFSRQYREHDYMLGRRNCQAFLKSWFTLEPDNAVFNPLKPPAVETPPNSGKFEIPIIPLYGSALAEQSSPEIPGKFDPASLEDQIEARADKLLRVAAHVDSAGWLARQAYKVVIGIASSKAADKVVNVVQAATRDSKLLNPK